MNTLLTGGTGLIGTSVCRRLMAEGHNVTILTRSPERTSGLFGPMVTTVSRLADIAADTPIDTVINLAGAPIADKRWSDTRKAELENSRIALTTQLVDWMAARTGKPACLISASAVGWYGNGGDAVLTEQSKVCSDDYAHRLCDAWEQAALTAEQRGIRVCLVRTGLVLAPAGGFLARMLPPFRLGLGGRIGSGRQYMPWIHLDDICALYLFLSQNNAASGIFNGTAPTPVTNAEFTHTLARILSRPALLPVPAFVLRLALGEMSSLLLGGQRAVPEKARAAGFRFQYTELEHALRHVIQQQ